MQPQDTPLRQIFDIPIAALNAKEVIARVTHAIETRARLQIGVVNAAKIVNMRRDVVLKEDVLSSDLILADGMSVVWASRILGQPLPERIAGIDLMFDILALADQRGFAVYCLGATPEVLDRVMKAIRIRYPNAKLVGGRDGYFAMKDAAKIMDEIAAAGPDILLVAMTSPKKEQFLAQAKCRLHVPVLHGVGGSFDVMAGKVRRAPEAWQRAGLEWLYRIVQEPRRMWRRYLVTNTLFCGLVGQFILRRFVNGAWNLLEKSPNIPR